MALSKNLRRIHDTSMKAEPISWNRGSSGSSRCTQQYWSGKLHQLSDLHHADTCLKDNPALRMRNT